MKVIDCRTKKYPLAFAIVDEDDWEFLSCWTWSLDGRGYPRRNDPSQKGKSILMHRQIMRVFDSGRVRIVDHINGNPLDNRKVNLRVCTSAENSRNSKRKKASKSGYKGVTWHKRDRKWEARICVNGKNTFIGNFDSAESAHEAYCKKAVEMHGDFANFGGSP